MATKKKTKTPKANSKNKTQAVVAVLRRAKGCTREEILAATEWPSISVQQHAKTAGVKLIVDDSQGRPYRYRAT